MTISMYRTTRTLAAGDPHRLTNKQYQILSAVITGTTDSEGNPCPLDIDQLLEILTYRTTKASIQFSLRALESRRLIVREYEKRRDRRHALIIPTKLGLRAMQNQFEPPRLAA